MNCSCSAGQSCLVRQQHWLAPFANIRPPKAPNIHRSCVNSRPCRQHSHRLQAAAEAACIAAAAAAAPSAAAGTWSVPLLGGSSLVLPSLWPACGPWGVWCGLILAGAFGMWSERTRLGKELSGALVATLAGMFLANAGYLPPHPPEADLVFKYLLPLAVPMLLLSANIGRILRETGTLLAAFLLGTLTTAAASVGAMALCPLTALGEEGWKIAAALTARHIGGAVNYMAVAESLSISPSTFGAGLAADDLILTLYFITLYSLAKHIPPDAQPAQQPGQQQAADGQQQQQPEQQQTAVGPSPPAAAAASSSIGGSHGGVGGRSINVYAAMMAVGLSSAICYLGSQLAALWGMPSQAMTVITGLTLALASSTPRLLAPLAASAEGLALMLMQVFFAAVGASADIRLVLATAPILFGWSFVALSGHLLLLLGLGRLAGFSRKELLLASNANIGGPSTVAGMAAAKGWTSLLVPAILTSTLGYALGTFIGIGLGSSVMKPLCR